MKYLFISLIIVSLAACTDNKISPSTTNNNQIPSLSNTPETTTEIVIEEDDTDNKADKLKKTSNGSIISNAKYSDSEGKEFSIENLRGKTVVIDYWATWCTPCLEDMPSFDKLSTDFTANRDLVFVKISIDEEKSTWTNYIKQNKNNSYWIGRDKTNPLYWLTYKKINYDGKEVILESLPRYAIIGPDGAIINNNAPSPQTNQLRSMINSLTT